MSETITLTIIEFIASVIVEGVILAGIFSHISNQSQSKQQQNLQQEMNNIEIQNKFIYTQLQAEIHRAKQDILSEIKEVQQNNKQAPTHNE
jgi:hypothetical protein